MAIVILGAEVDGRPGIGVRVEGGRIAAVGPDVERTQGDDVVAAAGGALIPGLHDHHVHLRSMAAAASSVPVGPPDVRDGRAFAERLCAAAAATPPGRWLRGIGYHDSVAGPLDRWVLDAVVADRPVRVQHRSGVLWVLNSAAVEATGADGCTSGGVEREGAGRPTGRLWRMDEWLRQAAPPVPLDFAAVSRRAAGAGVTGFTDATPSPSPDDSAGLIAAVQAGELGQRVHLMSAHGAPPPPAGGLSEGPYKILLDDDALPPVDDLGATIAGVHAGGRPVAVHCVTRAQLVTLLLALEVAGARPGDRIEHGAVIPDELIAGVRSLGLLVVSQPNFVAERGDRYLVEVDPDDVAQLYRAASLVAAGIGLAAGTDAPFGDADPWAAMRAAVERRTAAGAALGPSERLAPAAALGLFLGEAARPTRPRRVAPGAAADLCLLDVPLAAALEDLSAGHVAMTMVAGDVVHRRGRAERRGYFPR